MPRLSIIIPTLGNWDALENTLISVLQNRPARSEIVVVHGRAYHDPYDLKDEITFVEAPSTRLVDLINVGLVATRAELIDVLACGAVVDEGWTAAAIKRFTDSRVAAVAPLVVDVHSPDRTLSAGRLWQPGGSDAVCELPDDRAAANGQWIGPDLAAAFYRRSALCKVGSLDATLSPGLAAVDIGLRLRHARHQAVLENSSRVMIEPSLLDRDSAFNRAWQCERLFWRHPGEHGWLRGIAAHGRLLAIEAVRSIPHWRTVSQIAGRLIGACDRRSARWLSIAAPVPASSATPLERRVDAPHAKPSHRSAETAKPRQPQSQVR